MKTKTFLNFSLKHLMLAAIGSIFVNDIPTAVQAQPNLVLNGDFSSGSANWNNNANGIYYYFDNTVNTNIVSFGWSDGVAIWQNTTASIEPGVSYELAVRGQVGQTPVTGLNISLQDVSTGWTVLANQNFTFASQSSGPDQWQTFNLSIPQSAISGAVGDTIGVGVAMNESPNTQQGWVWLSSVSLVAVPVPEPTSLAVLGLGALGVLVIRCRK